MNAEERIKELTKQVEDLQWELRDSQAECAGLRRLNQKLQAKTPVAAASGAVPMISMMERMSAKEVYKIT
jgi:regulator of replication initiation timing